MVNNLDGIELWEKLESYPAYAQTPYDLIPYDRASQSLLQRIRFFSNPESISSALVGPAVRDAFNDLIC